MKSTLTPCFWVFFLSFFLVGNKIKCEKKYYRVTARRHFGMGERGEVHKVRNKCKSHPTPLQPPQKSFSLFFSFFSLRFDTYCGMEVRLLLLLFSISFYMRHAIIFYYFLTLRCDHFSRGLSTRGLGSSCKPFFSFFPFFTTYNVYFPRVVCTMNFNALFCCEIKRDTSSQSILWGF